MIDILSLPNWSVKNLPLLTGSVKTYYGLLGIGLLQADEPDMLKHVGFHDFALIVCVFN